MEGPYAIGCPIDQETLTVVCLSFSATSHPFPWKWELHDGIVPLEEDYLEYSPIRAALWPTVHGLREFLTLTTDNVSTFQFSDFKVNVLWFVGFIHLPFFMKDGA